MHAYRLTTKLCGLMVEDARVNDMISIRDKEYPPSQCRGFRHLLAWRRFPSGDTLSYDLNGLQTMHNVQFRPKLSRDSILSKCNEDSGCPDTVVDWL